MSKVNAIRVVNLNYGEADGESGKIRIMDNIMDCHQENTFVSLGNASGKSVIIQNVQSLLVSHDKRDLKHRKFDDFHRKFSNSLPTIVMMELALDNHNGYVLLGKVVIRHKVASEPLTVYNFISEYKNPDSKHSVRHLPIYDVEEGQLVYKKTIEELHQCMDEWSKDKKSKFQMYNFSISYQRTAYYKELKRFGLDSKVFDHTSHKINCSESGITHLYIKYINQDKFVTEEIFPVIYDKFDLENDKYRDKIKGLLKTRLKQDQQHQFMQFLDKVVQNELNERLLPLTKDYFATYQEQDEFFSTIEAIKYVLEQQYTKNQGTIQEQVAAIEQFKQERNSICYRKESANYYHIKTQLDKAERTLEESKQQQTDIEDNKNKLQARIDLEDCLYGKQTIDQINNKIKAIEARIDAQSQDKNTQEEINHTGAQLYQAFHQLISNKEQQSAKLTDQKNQLTKQQKNLETENDDIKKDINTTQVNMKQLELELEKFAQEEKSYNTKFKENLSFEKDLFHRYLVDNLFEQHQSTLSSKITSVRTRIQSITLELQANNEQKEQLEKEIEQNKEEKDKLFKQRVSKEQQLKNMTKQIDVRREMIRNFHLSSESLYDKSALVEELTQQITELKQELTSMTHNIEAFKKQLALLDSGNVEKMSQDLAESFDELGIEYDYGIDLLKHQGASASEIIKSHPILPYALVLDDENFMQVKEHQNELIYTDKPIYMVNRASLRYQLDANQPSSEAGGTFVYARFNEELLDEESLERKKAELDDKINGLKQQIDYHQAIIDERTQKIGILNEQTVTEDELRAHERNLQDIKYQQEKLIANQQQLEQQKEDLKSQQKKLQTEKNTLSNEQEELEEQQAAFSRLTENHQTYLDNIGKITILKDSEKHNIDRQKHIEKNIEDIINEINDITNEQMASSEKYGEFKSQQNEYLAYQEWAQTKEIRSIAGTEVDILNRIKELKDYYARLEYKISSIKDLLDEQKELKKQQKDATDHFENKLASCNIARFIPDYQQILDEQSYSEERRKKVSQEKEQLETQLKELREQSGELNKEIGKYSASLEGVKEHIYKLNYQAPCSKEELVQLSYHDQLSYYENERTNIEQSIAEVEQKITQLEEKEYSIEKAVNRLKDRFDTAIEKPDTITKALEQTIQTTIEKQQLKDYITQQIHQAKDLKDKLANKKQAVKKQIKQMNTIEITIGNVEIVDSYHNLLEWTATKVDENDSSIMTTQEQYIEHFLRNYDFIQNQVAAFKSEVQEIAQFMTFDLEKLCEEINKIDRGTGITINHKNEKLFQIKVKSDLLSDTEALKHQCHQYLQSIIKKYYRKIDAEEQQLFKDISFNTIFHKIIGFEAITIFFKVINENGSVSRMNWEAVQQKGVPSGAQRSCIYLAILLSIINYISKDSQSNIESTQGKFLIMDNPFAQTQTKSFVKVLLDIAEKSNTQFISFSAIQMPEIYNQFNNIILLKPAPSDAQGIRHMTQQVFIQDEAEDDINHMYMANIVKDSEQIGLDL